MLRQKIVKLAPSREKLTDIAALQGLSVGVALFDAVKAYRDWIEEQIANEAKISDELPQDFRWMSGMKEALNAVLGMPAEAVRVLNNEESRK